MTTHPPDKNLIWETGRYREVDQQHITVVSIKTIMLYPQPQPPYISEVIEWCVQ